MFPINRIAAIAAGGTASYLGFQKVKNEDLITRNAFFWAKAFPVYMHYRWTVLTTQNLQERDKDVAFDILHKRYAPVMDEVIRHLRGFYIKIGQLGATREDFLPEPYLKTSRRLQNDCPCEPFQVIKNQVETSMGKPLGDVFSFFEETPLGTASIGQTHRATLKDGTHVVVKVQLPHAENKFRIDMRTIIAFCALAQPAHLPFLHEIEKQFLTEFDYIKEAENLELIRNNIMPIFGSKVVIPKPFKTLCTKEVLVMEELDGDILSNVIRHQYERIAASRGMTLDELRLEQLKKDHEALLKGDELENGPSSKTFKTWQWIVWGKNLFPQMLKWCLSPILGEKKTEKWLAPIEEMPINIPEIFDLVLQVHGHELFVNGAFNGDPHPGNILYLKDGKLGLIDYGQVKIIPKEMRLNLARLCLAIAQDRMELAVDILLNRIGLKVKNPDDMENLKLRCHMQFNRDDHVVTGETNAQAAFERVELGNPVTFMPDDAVMPFRLSLLMRGIGFSLRYPVATAPIWSDIARSVLLKEGENVNDENSLDGSLVKGLVLQPRL